MKKDYLNAFAILGVYVAVVLLVNAFHTRVLARLEADADAEWRAAHPSKSVIITEDKLPQSTLFQACTAAKLDGVKADLCK